MIKLPPCIAHRLLPVLFGLLAACQPVQAAPAQLPAPTRTLQAAALTPAARPSHTPAPTRTREPTAAIIASPTAPPSPTPTMTRTRPPGSVYTRAGQATVPILMYHNVSNKGSTPYILRLTSFRAQMRYLYEEGYETVTVSELAEVIRGGGHLPAKPVVITFDDGFLSVYENALPILDEFGFRAVVYVISGTVGTNLSYGYMQAEELQDLAGHGWEIGSHSVTHSNLKTTTLGLRNEVEGSQKDLEEKLGVPVRSFAYPYNVANAWIRERVEEYGYESAVGVDIFNTHPAKRLFFLSRREVRRGLSLGEFRDLLEKDGG